MNHTLINIDLVALYFRLLSYHGILRGSIDQKHAKTNEIRRQNGKIHPVFACSRWPPWFPDLSRPYGACVKRGCGKHMFGLSLYLPSRQLNISTSGEDRFKYLLPWENKISHMLYPRANKNNQIPTPCPASLPPPPSITLIGALAGRSLDTARSRNQSDCRIWRISLSRKLGKRQSVTTVVLLKTSKKTKSSFRI